MLPLNYLPAARFIFIVLAVVLLLSPPVAADTCSNVEPQPIGIDFTKELITASYAYAPDNITFLAAVKSTDDEPYSNFMFRLRLEDFEQRNVSKLFKNREPPESLFQFFIAMSKYCLSKVASKLSALDHPAFIAIKDSSALQFVRDVSRGLSRATEPLLRAINGQWKDEMTPENLKEGFVAVLKRVKEDALKKNDINITFAILSVPDFFNGTVNQILQEACVNVGIETIKPFSRTMMGVWGANTTRDARVLVIDQGQFHLGIRTYQDVWHYKKPLLQMYLPLDPFGSQAIDGQLTNQVLRTNKVLREQISLGANRQQLHLELARARLLIKDNLDVLMGKSSEGHHHEEWPLDLKDWWIGEEENVVLLWKDVEVVEDAYVESLGESILTFLVTLRMRREKSTDQHIPPEDIDVAVIMTTHGDGELLERAVSKSLGRQVEIKGGALYDMMLAADGAALAAWNRLESWQETQRYKQHKYGKGEEGLEHNEL